MLEAAGVVEKLRALTRATVDEPCSRSPTRRRSASMTDAVGPVPPSSRAVSVQRCMRIVVAMSGGVDSSVAAALLAEQGHEVIGLSMQLYDQREGRGRASARCCTHRRPARRAARRRAHRHPALHRQLRAAVRRAGRLELRRASTPPGARRFPCVHCNGDLKFATLARARARRSAPTCVATGHYARVERDDATGTLPAAARRRPGEGSVVLPVLARPGAARARDLPGRRAGPRPTVREYARELGLPVADKPDSQEICFVPDGDYARVRRAAGRRTPRATASSRRRTATSLGRHDGVHRFTVGQRKGLGLLVAAFRSTSSRIEPRGAAPSRSSARRARSSATTLTRVGRELDCRRAAGAPVRASPRRSAIATATPPPRVDAARRRRARASTFDEPQRAVTPGQAVVFYDGDVVVGGGWID